MLLSDVYHTSVLLLHAGAYETHTLLLLTGMVASAELLPLESAELTVNLKLHPDFYLDLCLDMCLMISED